MGLCDDGKWAPCADCLSEDLTWNGRTASGGKSMVCNGCQKVTGFSFKHSEDLCQRSWNMMFERFHTEKYADWLIEHTLLKDCERV